MWLISHEKDTDCQAGLLTISQSEARSQRSLHPCQPPLPAAHSSQLRPGRALACPCHDAPATPSPSPASWTAVATRQVRSSGPKSCLQHAFHQSMILASNSGGDNAPSSDGCRLVKFRCLNLFELLFGHQARKLPSRNSLCGQSWPCRSQPSLCYLAHPKLLLCTASQAACGCMKPS